MSDSSEWLAAPLGKNAFSSINGASGPNAELRERKAPLVHAASRSFLHRSSLAGKQYRGVDLVLLLFLFRSCPRTKRKTGDLSLWPVLTRAPHHLAFPGTPSWQCQAAWLFQTQNLLSLAHNACAQTRTLSLSFKVPSHTFVHLIFTTVL